MGRGTAARQRGGGGVDAPKPAYYAKARRLRREMSLPEVLLWQELRQSDVKFRRQHPIGPYAVDCYCAAAKTGFEVDGVAHDMGDRPTRDEERDAFLATRGVTIVRIPASDVLGSAQDTADAIIRMCR